MVLFYLSIALFSGLMIANQSPINADLRTKIGSPFIAATISFGIGAIFLGIISLLTKGQIFPSIAFIEENPAWIWLGGILGAVFLTSNVLLFPILGSIQTVILPILGQILAGLVIDNFGLFSSHQVSLTSFRIIGIIIVITGIAIAVVLPNFLNQNIKALDRNITKNTNLASKVKWQSWAIVSGAFAAIQQAINSHLGVLLHSPAQGAFTSFFIGFISIMLFTIFHDQKLPLKTEFKKIKLWNLLGGILGSLFVFSSVIVVPHIGTGLTIMLSLLGQIIGSMLVQQFGLWHSIKLNLKLVQVIGVIVMICGLMIIKLL